MAVKQDTEDGLLEFPHVILNQARVYQLYLDVMRNSSSRNTAYYNRPLDSVAIDKSNTQLGDTYPVEATFNVDAEASSSTEIIRSKYVIGGDGARSAVRSELKLELKGDSANQVWGDGRWGILLFTPHCGSPADSIKMRSC